MAGKFAFVYTASKLWETVPTNLKRLSTSSCKKWYKIISSNVSHSFELPIKIHFVVVSNIVF